MSKVPSKQSRKLSLNRETLRNLSNADLKRANGGVKPDPPHSEPRCGSERDSLCTVITFDGA